MLEVEFEDRIIVFKEDTLIKIQALWRGALVRLHFSRLKENYEKLFKSIELNDQSEIYWKSSHISLPRVPAKKTVIAGSISTAKQIDKEQLYVYKSNSIQSLDCGSEKSNSSSNIENDADIVKSNQLDILVQEGGSKAKTDTGTNNTLIVESVGKQNEETTSEQNVDASQDSCTHVSNPDSDQTILSVVPTLGDAEKTEVHLQRNDIDPDTEMQHSGYLPNQTSVWNSDSDRDVNYIELFKKMEPNARDQLRSNLAMELLWVQQAICSRKQYLNLKNGIVTRHEN